MLAGWAASWIGTTVVLICICCTVIVVVCVSSRRTCVYIRVSLEVLANYLQHHLRHPFRLAKARDIDGRTQLESTPKKQSSLLLNKSIPSTYQSIQQLTITHKSPPKNVLHHNPPPTQHRHHNQPGPRALHRRSPHPIARRRRMPSPRHRHRHLWQRRALLETRRHWELQNHLRIGSGS